MGAPQWGLGTGVGGSGGPGVAQDHVPSPRRCPSTRVPLGLVPMAVPPSPRGQRHEGGVFKLSPCPPRPRCATHTTLQPTLAQLSTAAAGRDRGFPGKMGVGGVPTCPPPKKKRTPRPTGGRLEPRAGPAIRLLRYELLDIRRRLCSLLNMHEPGLRGWGATAASQKGGGGAFVGCWGDARWKRGWFQVGFGVSVPICGPCVGMGLGGPQSNLGVHPGGQRGRDGMWGHTGGRGLRRVPSHIPKICPPPKNAPPRRPLWGWVWGVLGNERGLTSFLFPLRAAWGCCSGVIK